MTRVFLASNRHQKKSCFIICVVILLFCVSFFCLSSNVIAAPSISAKDESFSIASRALHLFNSDIRLSLEEEYLEDIESYHQDTIQRLQDDPSSPAVTPFLIEINTKECGSRSHHMLMSHIGGHGRYELLSSHFAIASLTWKQLQSFSSVVSLPRLIKSYIALHPGWKLHKDILSMKDPSQCEIQRHKQHKMKIEQRSRSMTKVSEMSPNIHRNQSLSVPSVDHKTDSVMVLRMVLHTPPSGAAYESFLQFLYDLEDSYRYNTSRSLLRGAGSSVGTVIRDIVMDLDEQAGYHGVLRKSLSSSQKRTSVRNVLTAKQRSSMFHQMHASREGDNQVTSKVLGDIYIEDCRYLYDIARRVAERPEVISVTIREKTIWMNKFARHSCDNGIMSSSQSNPLDGSSNGSESSINKLLTGEGGIVGIADSGLSLSHCYFYDHDHAVSFQFKLHKEEQGNGQTGDDDGMRVINSEHRKVIQYVAFVDTEENDSGHGSHIAGSVVGSLPMPFGNNSSLSSFYPDYFYEERFTSHQGMSPNAKLAFFDIGGKREDDIVLPVDLNRDMFQVMHNQGKGATIFVNAWGSSSSSETSSVYSSDTESVDRFMYDHPNTLLIFAAGNENDAEEITDKEFHSPNRISGPASGKNVLTVGASLSPFESWHDRFPHQKNISSKYFDQDTVAYFSSMGPTSDHRLKPDLLAPGWWIVSAAGVPQVTQPYCGLFPQAGTSSAAAIVGGFALKVQEYFRKGYYPSGQVNENDGFEASGALLKAILIHSSRPMKYLNTQQRRVLPLTQYPSIVQGYGRLELASTLKFHRDTDDSEENEKDLFVVDTTDAQSFSSGNVKRHIYYLRTKNISVDAIRVTLCYTDYPSSVLATEVMVNLLDLRVHEIVVGNESSSDLLAVKTVLHRPYLHEHAKTVSNVQMIDISSPSPDALYAITVTARFLVTQSQSYSLVATGAFAVIERDSIDESVKTSIEGFDDSVNSEDGANDSDNEGNSSGVEDYLSNREAEMIYHVDDFTYYYADDDHPYVNDDDSSRKIFTDDESKQSHTPSAIAVIAGASISGAVIIAMFIFIIRRIRNTGKFDEKHKEFVKRLTKPGLTTMEGSLNSMQCTDDESDSHLSWRLETMEDWHYGQGVPYDEEQAIQQEEQEEEEEEDDEVENNQTSNVETTADLNDIVLSPSSSSSYSCSQSLRSSSQCSSAEGDFYES